MMMVVVNECVQSINLNWRAQGGWMNERETEKEEEWNSIRFLYPPTKQAYYIGQEYIHCGIY